MASPDVVLETIAADHAGFPPILWRVVRDVLGSPTLPMYKVFECAPSPAGSTFRVDVHISPWRRGTKQPYLVHGGIMPTRETAIQVAAWEAIARLRHSEAVMSRNAAFRPYPSRPAEGAELIHNLNPKETHPAIPSLLSYVSAVTLLSRSLAQELMRTRDKLVRSRMRLFASRNLIVPFQLQT